MPITIASSGSGTGAERRATPRRSASACATDGGPANAAAAVTSRARPCRIRRRTPPGSSTSVAPATDERLDRRVVVGVAAQTPREPRRVEDERRADHRDPVGQRLLEGERDLPAARRGRLEQRVRARAAQDLRAGGADERAGAAVEHGLGRRDGHDEVGRRRAAGCTRSSVRPASPTVRSSSDSASCTSTRPRNARAAVGASRASSSRLPARRVEPAGDEDRLALRRDAQPLELADRGLERRLTGIDRSARQRQRRAARRRASPCRPASRAPRAAGRRAGSAASPARPRRRRRSPPAAAAAGAGAHRRAP